MTFDKGDIVALHQKEVLAAYAVIVLFTIVFITLPWWAYLLLMAGYLFIGYFLRYLLERFTSRHNKRLS